MLEKCINKIERHYKCISDCPFCVIVRPGDGNNGNLFVGITGITEEEEKQLESGMPISIERGCRHFYIQKDDCLAYGTFDMSPNSKDIKTIGDAKWFKRLDINTWIPSEYDYETHSIITYTKGRLWYDTNNIETLLPYYYACLNKPERIVIFKEVTSIFLRKKSKINKNKETKDKPKQSAKEKKIKIRTDKISKLTIKLK